MLKKIREHRKYKILKQILRGVTGSFSFKLFLAGFIIISLVSAGVYYAERNYINYTIVDGQQVEDSSRSSNIRTPWDSVWWTFVTSFTVGYGDYFPRSVWGRIVGILTMFFGIGLISSITANIASLLVEKQLKEDKGLDTLNLKNHFIICGWKREMALFLHDILSRNTNFLPSEVVLVNTAEPEKIENLKMEPELRHINYIYGDYIDERVLNRANLKEASRVLVLADILVQGSSQEIDSRTVMTIITIKSMSKSIYTCAELISAKFKRYLTISNCDEIVLSSDYNRYMIANASSGSGISHIVSELLDVNTDVGLNTVDIPKNFIGGSYESLERHLRDKNKSLVIGILENTGNFYTRKTNALREAQKTADIPRLIENLKMVKTLVPNLPVINPPPDYVIQIYSKAIVIEGSQGKTNTTGRSSDVSI